MHERGTRPPDVEAGSEPGWQGFSPLTVTRLAQETDQVLSVELHAEGRGALPTPLPGQYLTLQVFGASDPAPVRSYSICAVTDSGGYRIAVKRQEGGLVSSWLQAHLRVGETLQAAAPRGVFTLDSRPDNPVVLISAGIGVTPVLAMLHALAATDSLRVMWWLHTTVTANIIPSLPRPGSCWRVCRTRTRRCTSAGPGRLRTASSPGRWTARH